MQSVNSAYLLNVSGLLFQSAARAAASASTPTIASFKKYACIIYKF